MKHGAHFCPRKRCVGLGSKLQQQIAVCCATSNRTTYSKNNTRKVRTTSVVLLVLPKMFILVVLSSNREISNTIHKGTTHFHLLKHGDHGALPAHILIVLCLNFSSKQHRYRAAIEHVTLNPSCEHIWLCRRLKLLNEKGKRGDPRAFCVSEKGADYPKRSLAYN